ADFNGDGKQDLAVVDGVAANNLQILKGNGDGTFQAAVSYNVGSQPRAVVAGDWDTDGDLDLATANYLGQNVSILRNAGDGTFTSAGTVFVDTTPRDLVAGDFDADGDLDLVAAGYWEYCGYFSCSPIDNKLRVLVGKGDGTFTAGPTYFDAAPAAVAAADF